MAHRVGFECAKFFAPDDPDRTDALARQIHDLMRRYFDYGAAVNIARGVVDRIGDDRYRLSRDIPVVFGLDGHVAYHRHAVDAAALRRALARAATPQPFPDADRPGGLVARLQRKCDRWAAEDAAAIAALMGISLD
jgi:hypothetical protein